MNRFNASPSGMDYRGSSCEGELHALLHQHLMVRRLKAEVGSGGWGKGGYCICWGV